ncbi:Dehydrogenase [uncultured Alphaproteobacteria bacterium]|uniref:Dehydrogenase n=1 Tax=uncultured Alphaproteobacteria bacterium TaxID=91750 RepID=A0A212KMD2_9PROT|nr:Dehydrogenase [uncultured Alphaproteobacteria bacterium]
MKALVYAAPEKVEIRDVPPPAPREGAVKVRMRYCGICGSDIGIFAGKHPRAKAPLILGHEFVGVVDEIGAGTRGRFKKGDRVVAYPLLSCGECLPCRTGTPHVCKSLRLIGIDVDGGIAEHAWIDEDVLFKVPEGLTDRVAALIEPLAVIVRSMHQARFKLLDSVVITGAGPIGVLTALVAKHSGASRVVISDIDEARLGLCRELGFEAVNVRQEAVVDYVARTTGGDGMDVVFECSGAESAALDMTRLCRIGGMICMTGVHKAPHAVDLRELNFKEQTIVGTRVYTKREFEMAVGYAAQLSAELEKVVTQVVPLSNSEGIFAMIADPAVNTVKVLVDCEN